MNLFKINFRELYERHLCRHSQFGINVIHLASVIGIYLALFALLAPLLNSNYWVLSLLTLPYFVTLAFNVPFRVLVASAVFMALVFGLLVSLPEMPIWLALILIVVSHKVQTLSHRFYDKELDMTEFNKKYKKGPVLFVLLLVYELPILLNYLLFGRRNWVF
jgi:hypothetical protein